MSSPVVMVQSEIQRTLLIGAPRVTVRYDDYAWIEAIIGPNGDLGAAHDAVRDLLDRGLLETTTVAPDGVRGIKVSANGESVAAELADTTIGSLSTSEALALLGDIPKFPLRLSYYWRGTDWDEISEGHLENAVSEAWSDVQDIASLWTTQVLARIAS